MMFSPEEEAFRAEVRAFVAEHTVADGFHFQGSKWPEVKALYRALAQKDWLALGWPKQAGGADAPVLEFILWDEMAYARAARPPLGAGIVAKTIARHGTDEQKRHFLPSIRSAEIFFSLGYSEPGAGSDLAGLSTRAERSGSYYVVRGEKCWTSYAQHSDFLWTLCRTGSVESRARGLSIIVIDLHAPGVTVRPLPTIDGEQLNQVILDEVRVPLENRVGPENGAWSLVKEALDVERHVQFPPRRVRRDFEDLAGLLRDHPVLEELQIGVEEVEALALLVLDSLVRGRPGDVEAACNKLRHTEMCQAIARAALDHGGCEATLATGGVSAEFLWRQSMWESIGGGTSEVMRSVVARQALGLKA
jgi:alkylation response protein AidB-like acyl-CoA dehydrogenase